MRTFMIVTVLCAAVPIQVTAQIRRLPPTFKQEINAARWTNAALATSEFRRSRLSAGALGVRPVGGPRELTESLELPQQVPAGRKLAKYKEGALQRLSLTATLVGGRAAEDYQATELELYATFGVPCPTRKSPLLITPGYRVGFLAASSTTDLPPRVHDAYLEFRWLRKLNERWGTSLQVTPGVHSDFHGWRDDAVQISGHAVAAYQWTPATNLVLGVAYLDRDDVGLLPAVGIICESAADRRYELLFPRPKISRRIERGPGHEHWIYLAGEFGGGSWLVERAAGVQDTVTARDFRAILGFEKKIDGGGGGRIEVAWVFGRAVEYRSGIGDFEPNAAAMIRGGVTY
ncbi:MAG: hypothetical protein VX988_03750 [Planctomycetota bacterium]|nr:hypothetical protein [Planctomycetota bacterium]